MAAKIVDASAAIALLFNEPDAARVADRLAGGGLAAPQLLPFEVANACLKKCRRHPSMSDGLMRAFLALPSLGIEMISVDHGGVLALAARTSLSAYDASYLWLARVMDAELVSLDRRLQQAHASLKE